MNNDFAKALNVPDLEIAQRSSAIMRCEREKKQLASYIIKIEKEIFNKLWYCVLLS